jgi:hypothetical protein
MESPQQQSDTNFCKKIRFLAKNIAGEQNEKIKDNFDKSALPHGLKTNDFVWFEEFAPLGKNPKLTLKCQGPAKITEMNDTNARVLLPNGKTKIYNIMTLKKFLHLLQTRMAKKMLKMLILI